VHPYTFVARTGFKEMLESDGAIEKVLPLLPRVCYGVRAALVSIACYGESMKSSCSMNWLGSFFFKRQERSQSIFPMTLIFFHVYKIQNFSSHIMVCSFQSVDSMLFDCNSNSI
jgi:hypothetical protein